MRKNSIRLFVASPSRDWSRILLLLLQFLLLLLMSIDVASMIIAFCVLVLRIMIKCIHHRSTLEALWPGTEGFERFLFKGL